jgi:glyoxylate reductase
VTEKIGGGSLVLSSLPLTPAHVAMLRSEGLEPVLSTQATSHDESVAIAWITRRQDILSEAEFASRPRLRVVSQFGVGYDNINLAAATSAGVVVCHTPEVLDTAVAELAIGLIIGLRRRLFSGRDHVREGLWLDKAAPLGEDVAGTVLAIVGFGRVGRRVAELAVGLGMRVIRPARRDDETSEPGVLPWDEVFAQADVVSVHVPLTDATVGLIGAPEFSRMKQSAYLVNTARGGIVDERALRDAVLEGAIAGAALDVLAMEPAGPDHELVRTPGVVVVPHIGSATHQTRAAMTDLAVSNVIDALTGLDTARIVSEQARVPAPDDRHTPTGAGEHSNKPTKGEKT